MWQVDGTPPPQALAGSGVRTPRAVEAGFRLLGPLSVTDGREVAVLPAGKPATLLAALLVRPNVLVSTDRLKSAVWGEATPASANSALHTCVRRLRRVLAGHGIPEDSIIAVSGGYRISADAETLDLIRFRQLVAAARAATDSETELDLLRRALSEWHGPLLANVVSDVLHRDEVPHLREERLAATERAIDIELALGRCRQVLAELWALSRTHPERERFWEQLIEALYRSGRQSEALAEYRGVKGHLQDELGVDPGPALQRLELAILRGDDLRSSTVPSITLRTVEPHPSGTTAPRPPLPPPPSAVPAFTGRTAQCEEIVTRIAAERTQPVTVVVSGPPGIGKTALALHVAGLVGDRFPGGRAAVRMTHSDGTPRAVAELESELRTALPDGGDDQPRLLVLDDVVDVELARSLIPTGTSSAAIITSRLSLGSLVATSHDSVVCRPGLFEDGESRAFLLSVLGRERVEREPEAVDRLATVCAHFPIALRIAATRLLTRPLLLVEDYVDWLEADPVSRLSLGVDDRLSVSTVFGTALDRLDAGLAEAFLELGASTESGPEGFSAADCTRLLTGWPSGPEEALELLADAGFLEEGRAGRFHIHQLLRLFARTVVERRRVAQRRTASLPRPREAADEYQAG